MNLLKCSAVVVLIGTLSLAFAQEQDEVQPAKLQIWHRVKQALLAADGDEYFEKSIKGSEFPRLTGTLISSVLNTDGVSKLVLGLTDGTEPEVTLILHHLKRKVKQPLATGSRITFEGMPSSFTKQPFMLTFEVENGKVGGIQFVAADTK